MSVSVCMAVHNGATFLEAQLKSILPQLDHQDEIVVSDDGSTDHSLALIAGFSDPRIRILSPRVFGNPCKNFEYALGSCRNELIFLSDQDDVWHQDKITVLANELDTCDLAICDCRLVDENGAILIPSFFAWNHSRDGVIKNILKNSFVGCCMAFRRNLLTKVLPFPPGVGMHDQWIGLMAMRHFGVRFIPQILVDHRRHQYNYSSTGGTSKNSWNKKVISRLQLAKAVLQH